MKTNCMNFFYRKVLVSSLIALLIPALVFAEDRLIVKDNTGATTFTVTEIGGISHSSSLLSNGASTWGAAPMVLGQEMGNRGVVITDKAASNPKNFYIGWDLGQSYIELFGLQENVGFSDLILNPAAGNVGIGLTDPAYLLEVDGVVAATDFVTTSSRKYKENIKELTVEEAVEAVKKLNPVHFNYKTNKEEGKVGFIAEDVPEIVATNDREHLTTMDIVAVLTKVVKEQQEAIEKLTERLNKIETSKDSVARDLLSSIN